MKTQMITSPSGDELVVLARSDYDALVAAAEARDEDADDIAAYDLRKAELVAGLDARLPPEVSARLLKGEGLLKSLRNWRDMTQMHLAFKTGVGQGYLSDLESGRRKGTPETLTMIAAALDVPTQWLVD
jgi:DNA-binding XRE family transcriptional regulator